MLTRLLLVFSYSATLGLAQHGYWGVQQNGNCQDPSGQNGQCISLVQCPHLEAILKQRPLTQAKVQFLRDAQCGFEGRYPKVCCALRRSAISIENVTNEVKKLESAWKLRTPEEQRQPDNGDHPNLRLLPTDCGFDTSDKIWGGGVTELDELPWMALLQYQTATGNKQFLCGGAVINKRYILTAAHCLHREDLKLLYQIVMVRLGEFDLTTDPDCDKDYISGKESCAPTPQDFGVEKIIIHPEYSPRSANKWYDIGLIRVNKDIKFTDFVKPVCLPLSAETRGRYVGNTVVVAGWGRTQTMKQSNLKMKIQLPVVSNEECNKMYQQKNRQIGESQLCAGGEKDRDSCSGDSGSPLMITAGNRYSVAGIVSYGLDTCGSENWPGVYTRVSDFTNWILDQLKQ
ncbi:hypothetical protein L9F63_012679 [Diploptera punctata]|uniref:CLIP domain-containing serine protease n=1 Tax=Diploptera punctata TaxID=6984 RepID=A0AAD8EMF0_DIPPU|nr:hypothetical protein L9F63_012679 [Diploptera punctata]